MKNILRVTAFILCLAISQLAYAGGIPVFDGVQEGNAIQQLVQMIEQLKQMEQQYEQLQLTYQKMTGSRPQFGSIFNDNKYKNYVPENLKQTYEAIRSGGYNSLTSTGQEVLRSNVEIKNNAIAMCSNLGEGQKRACERQVMLAAQDRGFSGEAYEKAKGRYERIQELIGKISGTDDQKAILELNARIQAEQALIQNEALKLQIYRMVADSERRLAEHQAHSANIKSMSDSQKKLIVDPIKFNR
jgi:type IV secretion system protein VirB5